MSFISDGTFGRVFHVEKLNTDFQFDNKNHFKSNHSGDQNGSRYPDNNNNKNNHYNGNN